MAASGLALSSSVCSQELAALSSINCSQPGMASQSEQLDMPSSPAGSTHARKKRKVYANDEERKERRRLSNRLSAKRMRQQRSMAMSQIQDEVYRLRQMCQALHQDNQQAMQEFHALQEENEHMQVEISRLESNLGHGSMPCALGMKAGGPDSCSNLEVPVSNVGAWDTTKGNLYQRGKPHSSSPQLQQMSTKTIPIPDRPRALPPKGSMHITHSMTITPHPRPTTSWQSASGCTKADMSSDVCSSRSMSGAGSDSILPGLLGRSPTMGSLHHDSVIKKEQVYSPTLSTPTSWHHDMSHPTIGVLQRTSGLSSLGMQRTTLSAFSTGSVQDKQPQAQSAAPSLPAPEDQVQSGLSVAASGMQMSSNLDDTFPGPHSKATASPPKMYYDMMACNEVLAPSSGNLGNRGSGNPSSDSLTASQTVDLCKLEPGSPIAGSQDLSSSYWSECMPSALDSMMRPAGSVATHMDTSQWLLGR